MGSRRIRLDSDGEEESWWCGSKTTPTSRTKVRTDGDGGRSVAHRGVVPEMPAKFCGTPTTGSGHGGGRLLAEQEIVDKIVALKAKLKGEGLSSKKFNDHATMKQLVAKLKLLRSAKHEAVTCTGIASTLQEAETTAKHEAIENELKAAGKVTADALAMAASTSDDIVASHAGGPGANQRSRRWGDEEPLGQGREMLQGMPRWPTAAELAAWTSADFQRHAALWGIDLA